MCTYQLKLDDDLVAQTESTLHEGVPFQMWLQKQVEALMLKQISRSSKHGRSLSRRGLSDEKLAEKLSKFAPLVDTDFPELDTSDYVHHLKCQGGRIPKGLEKWL